jgi:hypothetical protein
MATAMSWEQRTLMWSTALFTALFLLFVQVFSLA